MHRYASTVATMEYLDSLCLPYIHSFTNSFIGQLFGANEVFASLKIPYLYWNIGASFVTYRI